MNHQQLFRWGCIAVLASAASAHLAFSAITETFAEIIEAGDIKRIEISIGSGSIQVIGSDREDLSLNVEQTVHTQSQKRADEALAEVERAIHQEGDTLYVRFHHNAPISGVWKRIVGRAEQVSFETRVELPARFSADLSTSGGRIVVERLEGDLEANTSGGGIRIANISGHVHVHTSGGSIKAANLASDADLSTSGGNIEIEAARGHIRARTSGGNISAIDIPSIKAETSGGRVHAEFPVGLVGNSSLKTSGGGISVRLPSQSALHLDAQTTGGQVKVNVDSINVSGRNNSKLDLDINGGGPRLELKTTGGSIKVEEA